MINKRYNNNKETKIKWKAEIKLKDLHFFLNRPVEPLDESF